MTFTEPILHVDMDAFFVEVERLRRPELVGLPVVVGGGAARGVVASASYEARRYGIHSAMPTGAARRRFPGLTVVPPDHREYERVSEQVFAIFRSVTPRVEGLSLDEAFLDVSGLSRHYPGPAEIGDEVRRRIRTEIGLPASVGIAAVKFIAKLASAAAKPDGLLQVPVTASLDFLHALPIRSLWGVGEATQAALEGMGVATVGDLAGLSAGVLERRLGAAVGGHLAALARGEDPRPVQPDHDTKSVSVSETYERDLTKAVEIETELLRLCERLASRMRRAGLAAHTVGLTVRFTDFVTITRNLSVGPPVNTGRDLWRAVRQLQGRVAWDKPVRLLGVAGSGLAGSGAPRQLSTADSERWDDLAAAIDGVHRRFGGDSLVPARLKRAPETKRDQTRKPD